MIQAGDALQAARTLKEFLIEIQAFDDAARVRLLERRIKKAIDETESAIQLLDPIFSQGHEFAILAFETALERLRAKSSDAGN